MDNTEKEKIEELKEIYDEMDEDGKDKMVSVLEGFLTENKEEKK